MTAPRKRRPSRTGRPTVYAPGDRITVDRGTVRGTVTAAKPLFEGSPYQSLEVKWDDGHEATSLHSMDVVRVREPKAVGQ